MLAGACGFVLAAAGLANFVIFCSFGSDAAVVALPVCLCWWCLCWSRPVPCVGCCIRAVSSCASCSSVAVHCSAVGSGCSVCSGGECSSSCCVECSRCDGWCVGDVVAFFFFFYRLYDTRRCRGGEPPAPRSQVGSWDECCVHWIVEHSPPLLLLPRHFNLYPVRISFPGK